MSLKSSRFVEHVLCVEMYLLKYESSLTSWRYRKASHFIAAAKLLFKVSWL